MGVNLGFSRWDALISMDRVLVVAVSGDCGPVILLSSGSNLEPAKIFSLFLSILWFGEMVEKYFIIFKQK